MDKRENTARDVLIGILAGLLWLLWQLTRWTLLPLLIVLEPLVGGLLYAFALLGTLAAFFWRFVVDPTGFPFFTVLGLSLACIPALAVYYLVLRLLAE